MSKKMIALVSLSLLALTACNSTASVVTPTDDSTVPAVEESADAAMEVSSAAVEVEGTSVDAAADAAAN